MKKRYIYTLAAALVWVGAGCNKYKDFGNVNQNPGATTKPITAALLTNAELSIVGLSTTGTPAISGGQYAQYFSETQYSGTSLYNLPQNDFTGYYSGVLYDLQNIININESKATSAVAKIIQQYVYWVLTDSWGDLPYSEALKGLDAIQPKYDTQEDIYKGIINTLTSAQAELDGSSLAGDIFYNGDVASWKRAANSIKLLAAVQLSKRYPDASGFAATAAKEAIAAKVIEDNSQNLQVNYPGGSFKSPWYNLYDGRKDFGESKTMTDLLKSYNDGRIATYGGAGEAIGNTASSDIGVTYGLARNNVLAFIEANPTWARVLRGDFRTQASTATIITAGEVYLARAEAAYLGWTNEAVNTNYEAGITASYRQWGLNVSSSYLSGSNVALSTSGKSASDYAKISIQRWIASYPDGHQAWNIWRKTATEANPKGYPALDPAPDAVNSSKKIVSRFVYPTAEYSTNEAHVKEAAARLTGGDTQDAHVWWDLDK
ncbi:SusD/RagB family nutrient-binding outer membrane lipoprotein [Mucilaginibacter litoreus]|uniref:SusD/RagB family nutrient-binding outer membrane lipoprotein n=1 Tax=Mucilaginibacter litoreus TaxID=1048221 RepID=A0ABW3AXT8_9SPHI